MTGGRFWNFWRRWPTDGGSNVVPPREPPPADTKIILGIPGSWETPDDIRTSIAERSGGFLLAGPVLMDTVTKQAFDLEVHDHDPQLHEAFRIAGGGSIASADLEAIAQHRHVLYCLSADVSPETARQMLRFGVGLLDAGGLAVKVESSGAGHSAARWRELAASDHLLDLYTAFVTLIDGGETFYSCGMHAFGLPDAAVPSDLGAETAAELLNLFNCCLVAERPSLADGHTFSVSADSPRFSLRKTACYTYEPDHTFYNPFGMWIFTRA